MDDVTHYVGDACPGGHWDEPSPAAQLVELRAAIRAKAAWWDANRPTAAAFQVTDDFLQLLGDEHE